MTSYLVILTSSEPVDQSLKHLLGLLMLGLHQILVLDLLLSDQVAN